MGSQQLRLVQLAGRGVDDPYIPGNLDLPEEDRVRMCQNLEAVKDVQAVSGDPQTMVCKSTKGVCEFYDSRPYQN
jgi:hypothetical protein